MTLTRRQSVAGAAVAGPFAGLIANPELAHAKNREAGYGPLIPTPEATTGEITLSLPDGFLMSASQLVPDSQSDLGLRKYLSHFVRCSCPNPWTPFRLVIRQAGGRTLSSTRLPTY